MLFQEQEKGIAFFNERQTIKNTIDRRRDFQRLQKSPFFDV